jgi:hypothetical protein
VGDDAGRTRVIVSRFLLVSFVAAGIGLGLFLILHALLAPLMDAL